MHLMILLQLPYSYIVNITVDQKIIIALTLFTLMVKSSPLSSKALHG